MTDKIYDRLKWIASILLPAIAALYIGLGKVWGAVIPYPTEISATIMLVDTFLGAILVKSSKDYVKEKLEQIED